MHVSAGGSVRGSTSSTQHTEQHPATRAATHHNTQQLQSTDVLLYTKAMQLCSRFEQDRVLNAKATCGTAVIAENLDSSYEYLL